MGPVQCPRCYTPLEVRNVTPCFICGGWPEVVGRFDAAAKYTEFRLPDWGYRLPPNETLPVNALQRVRLVAAPQLGRDKFCPTCNLRLAFLTIITRPE